MRDETGRQVRQEQQVDQSVDSESEGEQDREEAENYGSSGCDDDFDCELGQLCRGEAVDSEAVSETSDAEEEDRSLLGAPSVGGKRPRAEGEDGLSALL